MMSERPVRTSDITRFCAVWTHGSDGEGHRSDGEVFGRCPAHDAVWWGVGGPGVLRITAGFPRVPESPTFLAQEKFLRILRNQEFPGKS